MIKQISSGRQGIRRHLLLYTLILFLLLFAFSVQPAAAWSRKLKVPLPYPESCGKSMVLTLHEPSKLMGENWYRLQITVPYPVAKDFPQKAKGEGWGVFLSVRDPGSITLAVEDSKACFGFDKITSEASEKLYFKETEKLTNSVQDYSHLHLTSPLAKFFGEPYDLDTVKMDDDTGAMLEFLIGLTPVGMPYACLQLMDKIIEADYRLNWAKTTQIPVKSDASGNVTSGEFVDSGSACAPRMEMTREHEWEYDYQSISWKRLCSVSSAAGPDQGYEINYFFRLVREKGYATDLLIRAVIPYRYVFGDHVSWNENRRDVEVEWITTLPGPEGPSLSDNLLLNPGGEDGDTSHWTVSSKAVCVKSTHGQLKPRSGKYFLSLSNLKQPGHTSGWLSQEVDVKECAGSQYTVSGFVSTDANDKGELVITFFDDQGTEIGTAKAKALGPSRLVWKEFKDTGQIPADAVKARFELKGKAVGSGELHTDVLYEDVSFRCTPGQTQ